MICKKQLSTTYKRTINGNIKAKTQLEKLGFRDPDRKNSKHDIIQMWVYENIEKVISESIMKDNPHPYKITKNEW